MEGGRGAEMRRRRRRRKTTDGWGGVERQLGGIKTKTYQEGKKRKKKNDSTMLT